MNIRKLTTLFFLTLVMNVSGQLGQEHKGIYLEASYCMMEMNYQEALNHFESLLSVSPDNHNLHFLMGDCCLKINSKTQQAIKHLVKAVEEVDPAYRGSSYKEHRAPPEAYLLLARAYHQDNQFNKAIDNYELFRDSTGTRKFPEIEFVNRQIKSCELAMSMITTPLQVQFRDVFHGSGQEFPHSNPVVSGNDSVIIFVVNQTRNNGVMTSSRTDDGWTKARKLNIELGITGDFFPVSLSFDGRELYLIKQDYYDSQVYVSRYENRRWGKVEELNDHINTRYYETHAAISRDGKTLYFTSDRKGGFGGLDIYKSDRDMDGNWGEAQNLGSTINTLYNEDTPFITKYDSKLYFSSEGHQTMGGYDIFYSERNSDDHWSPPKNLGYPLNTCKNDLFYNPGWNDRKSYYAWHVPGQDRKQLKSIQLNPGMETHPEPPPENVAALVPEPSEAPSANEYLTLNNILFDYNSHELNQNGMEEAERILKVMQELPEITLELTGHTDSKGLAGYNLQLSLQRARSVARYLTDRGVSEGRIEVFGSGEHAPVAINQYEDGSDAPKGRLLNRYTSLKFNNLPDDRIRVSDILVPDWLSPVHDRKYTILLTENEQEIRKMPDQFYGKPVLHVTKEGAHYYLVDAFTGKEKAMEFLNNAIDYGFPEARIFEKQNLDQMIIGTTPGHPNTENPYTIQIIALKKPRDVSYFRELGLVRRYDGKDGLKRYTTGKFASKTEAGDELRIVRGKGYKDAFILSVQECERKSVTEGPSAIMAQNR